MSICTCLRVCVTVCDARLLPSDVRLTAQRQRHVSCSSNAIVLRSSNLTYDALLCISEPGGNCWLRRAALLYEALQLSTSVLSVYHAIGWHHV